MKWWSRLSIVALVFLLFDLVWLGQLDRGGPPHVRVDLQGDVPATLTVPRPESGEVPPFGLPEPPPPGERPPALVLVHGFSGDRAMMSPLARSLAEAGYAVLSIDVRGHGENRRPLGRGIGDDDGLVEDIAAGVDFLRTSPYVDGTRISVGGHSMGAGASLSYGGRDSGIDAVLLISGGWRLSGPHRPRNVLFLYAEDDPERTHGALAALAAELSDEGAPQVGQTVGNPAEGTGVRLVEIPGTNHVDVITADRTVAESVAWLDAVYAVERAEPAAIADPRMQAQGWGSLAFLLFLPGLGIAVGRLATRVAEAPGGRVGKRLGLFAGALVVTLPLVAVEGPAEFLPLAVADTVVLHFAYAGGAILAWLAASGQLALASRTGRMVQCTIAAVIGFAAIYALFAPLSVTLHRMVLGPERALIAMFVALFLLPFCLASNLLLRQGSTLRATLASLGGHAIVVATLVFGALLQITSGIIFLMLPIFVTVLLSFEIVATGIYAASRNVTTIAILEALWLAWSFAALMPMLA